MIELFRFKQRIKIGYQDSLERVFVLLVSTILGMFPKDKPSSLAFPVRGGRYLNAEGGDGKWSFLLNYHYG